MEQCMAYFDQSFIRTRKSKDDAEEDEGPDV
jgi:hypothetical protein